MVHQVELFSDGLNLSIGSKLMDSSPLGDDGIPGVGVKSIDIRRNTDGEGSHLELD